MTSLEAAAVTSPNSPLWEIEAMSLESSSYSIDDWGCGPPWAVTYIKQRSFQTVTLTSEFTWNLAPIMSVMFRGSKRRGGNTCRSKWMRLLEDSKPTWTSLGELWIALLPLPFAVKTSGVLPNAAPDMMYVTLYWSAGPCSDNLGQIQRHFTISIFRCAQKGEAIKILFWRVYSIPL